MVHDRLIGARVEVSPFIPGLEFATRLRWQAISDEKAAGLSRGGGSSKLLILQGFEFDILPVCSSIMWPGSREAGSSGTSSAADC